MGEKVGGWAGGWGQPVKTASHKRTPAGGPLVNFHFSSVIGVASAELCLLCCEAHLIKEIGRAHV